MKFLSAKYIHPKFIDYLLIQSFFVEIGNCRLERINGYSINALRILGTCFKVEYKELL